MDDFLGQIQCFDIGIREALTLGRNLAHIDGLFRAKLYAAQATDAVRAKGRPLMPEPILSVVGALCCGWCGYRWLASWPSTNRAAVQDDRVCGCAHCLNFFPGMSVRSWVNVSEDPTEWSDDTAACPFCGHDAVLPSVSGWPMSVPFFYALHELLYPNDGYSDPNTIVFRDSREEVATLREEGIDRSAAYEVCVRPSTPSTKHLSTPSLMMTHTSTVRIPTINKEALGLV